IRPHERRIGRLTLDAMHGRGIRQVDVVRGVLERDDSDVRGIVDPLQFKSGRPDPSDLPRRTILNSRNTVVSTGLHDVPFKDPLFLRTNGDPPRADLFPGDALLLDGVIEVCRLLVRRGDDGDRPTTSVMLEVPPNERAPRPVEVIHSPDVA